MTLTTTTATMSDRALTAVAQAAAPREILPQRQEILFRDGSTVTMHPVRCRGHQEPELTLRAICWDHTALVFDLTHLVAEPRGFQADLLRLERRDRAGAVFMTLRQNFTDAQSFLDAVRDNQRTRRQPL